MKINNVGAKAMETPQICPSFIQQYEVKCNTKEILIVDAPKPITDYVIIYSPNRIKGVKR